MSGWASRSKTVLVMWEYTAEHSPIWARSADLDIGNLDARSLGLGEVLRDDLADWNRRCEVAADPSDPRDGPSTAAEWRGLVVESYRLAARVQRGLGDDWTVWCGGGDGGLRDPAAFAYLARTSGIPILLRTGGPVEWTPSRVVPALDRFDAALHREVHAWRGVADRLGPAEHRARGLELAGRLRAVLPSAPVLWFGGGDVPI